MTYREIILSAAAGNQFAALPLRPVSRFPAHRNFGQGTSRQVAGLDFVRHLRWPFTVTSVV